MEQNKRKKTETKKKKDFSRKIERNGDKNVSNRKNRCNIADLKNIINPKNYF